MTRLVAAELLKLRTTRTFWALAGSGAALVLLIVVLSLLLDDALDDASDVRSLLSTVGICGLLTLVLGVVVAAGEYRHGTIASTLLVTPQRLRAVSAAADPRSAQNVRVVRSFSSSAATSRVICLPRCRP